MLRIDMEEILTVGETAVFLKKHPDTIRRWILAKKLPARKLPVGKNGVFVLLRTDLLEVLVTKSLEGKRKNKPVKPRPDSPQIKLPME